MLRRPHSPLSAPPKRLCLLRLSAIGDVTHVLPVLRTLQQHWPQTAITWVIGRVEHALVGDIDGVEFIVFDKSQGWSAYRTLWQQLRGRHFDVLLQMQVSMRANIASLCIPAVIRLGFDRQRAKDYQWLWTNCRIAAVPRQHVLDSFFEFLKALGLHERVMRWDIPITEQDQQWASTIVGDAPVCVINPSSSQRLRNWRNWRPAYYAQLIAHAIEEHGMQVLLTGGPAESERALADAILADPLFGQNPHLREGVRHLVGQTSLKQLAAVMQRSTVVIAPDTGPAHIANAMGVAVIGLYVTSNPKRTGPYHSLRYTVNRYPQALQQFEQADESTVPWGKRVRSPDAMDLISVDEVKVALNHVLESRT